MGLLIQFINFLSKLGSAAEREERLVELTQKISEMMEEKVRLNIMMEENVILMIDENDGGEGEDLSSSILCWMINDGEKVSHIRMIFL